MTLFDDEWPLDRAKDVLINQLRTLGFASVTIAYDGESDEGQIHDIIIVDGKGDTTQLPLWERGHPMRPVADALECFAFKVLDAHHSGFEINEGGCGTLTIDVVKGTIGLAKYDKVIELVGETVEV